MSSNGSLGQNGLCERNESSWEEVSMEVPWGTVTGKWWGSRNKQPILAVHGWQENCGTFDELCLLIDPSYSIFCFDLPGHGKSSPFPKGMQYFLFWGGITMIRRVVKHFGWTDIILIGHSMGGALTFMYASVFPDEVSKLIMVDNAGPALRNTQKQAEEIGALIDKALEYEALPDSKIPCYEYNELIKIVMDAYGGSADERSVKILMRRGLAPVPNKNGYRFTRDVRLKFSILGMFNADQILTHASLIKCKVLNVRGVPGMKFENPEIYEQLIDAMRKNAELVILRDVPGTHHLHLITPELVAAEVNEFLKI